MILPTLLIATVAYGHPHRTMGKTDEQILQMGQSKWFAYYAGQKDEKNESKKTYIDARYSYGYAVRRVSDRILSNPHFPNRGKAKQLVVLVDKLTEECEHIGYAIDPNTGWYWVESRLYADSQDAIYGYLHPQGRPKPRPMVVSDVAKPISQIAKQLDGADNELTAESTQVTAKAKYKELRTNFGQIVRLISQTTGRTGSDRILSYCKEAVDSVGY
jgi:hypothetical protein